MKIKTWLSRRVIIKELLSSYRSSYGRARGRIVLRHRRAPFFTKVHNLDNFRVLWNIYGLVVGLEKNLCTQTYVALISYPIGVISYIPAVAGLSIGDRLITGWRPPIYPGNSMPLINIPLNTRICRIESYPGSGARFVKSPGGWAVVHSKHQQLAKVVFRNGAVKFLKLSCLALLGSVSNSRKKLRRLRKAGDSYKLGRRPQVRGVAKNPVDHPHGGGKGKKSKNAVPEAPWGRFWKRKKRDVKLRF